MFAEKIIINATRAVSAIWLGIIGPIICEILIAELFFPDAEPPSLKFIIIPVLALIFIILGWIYGYKILMTPYKKSSGPTPTYLEIFFLVLYSGLILLFYGFFVSALESSGFYLYLFSLIGISTVIFGYQILKLPSETKSIFKSALIGFIVSTFVLIMLFLPFLLHGFIGSIIASFSNQPSLPAQQDIILSPFIDPYLVDFRLVFFIYAIFSFCAAPIGIISAVILYFISRLRVNFFQKCI